MGQKKMPTRFWLDSVTISDHLEAPGVEKRVTWTLLKYYQSLGTGFVWVTRGISNLLCRLHNMSEIFVE
jgi:hypothetical protein